MITLYKRTSLVNGVGVSSFAESSICQVGDSNEIIAYDAVFALQKRLGSFSGNEGAVEHDTLSKKEMPFPAYPTEVNMAVFHEVPFINVNRIRVIGISSSSLLHIGSTNRVFMQAKIKHIREYDILPEQKPNEEQADLHDMFDKTINKKR
jgi:spore germination protein PE